MVRIGGGIFGRAQPVERRFQLDRHRHFDAHRQAGRGGDGIGDETVERVGQRHHQRAVLDRERQGAGAAQEARRDGGGFWRQGFGIARRRHHRDPEQFGKRRGDIALADQAELQQHRFQPLPALRRHPPPPLQSPRVAAALGQQSR